MTAHRFLATLALLAVCREAAACPVVCHAPVRVVAPVVVKKVVREVVAEVVPVAVFAPLAVQVPVYSAGANPGHVTPPAAPAPAPAPAPPPAPATAPQQPGQDAVLQAIRGLSLQISEQGRRLDALERKAGVDPEPPPPPAPPKKPDDPFDPPPPLPASGGTPPGPPALPRADESRAPAPAGAARLALAAAQGRCARCHTAGALDSGTDYAMLSGGAFTPHSPAMLAGLGRRLARHDMPPVRSGVPPLTPDEESAFLAWISEQKAKVTP